MTIEANRWPVGVSADAPVGRVGLRLAAVRSCMADDAREDRVVRRVGMAVRADRPVMRLFEPRMVEGRAEPVGSSPGRMAGHASGRVLRGDVIWHAATKSLCALPGCEVATIAIRVRRSQGVIAADVAGSAWRGHMGSGQCPTRSAVIKLAVGPVESVVASRALRRRESCGDVIRNVAAESRRALPRSDMATVAVRIRGSERVVVADVTIRTGHDFSSRL